jgi:WG containing repeat
LKIEISRSKSMPCTQMSQVVELAAQFFLGPIRRDFSAFVEKIGIALGNWLGLSYLTSPSCLAMSIRCLCIALLICACHSAQAGLPALIPLRVGDRFGYCDATQKIVIPAEFEDAMPFGSHGGVVKKDGHYGILDAQGKWLMPAMLDGIQVGHGLRLRKGTRYALANLEGCLVSDFAYDAIHELKNGFFLTERDGMKGLLDLTGQQLVPPAFDHISQLRDNQGNYVDLFAVTLGNLQGIYNVCAGEMQAPRYGRIDVFQEGYAVVQEGNRFGLIDLEGMQRVPCQYDLLQPMSEGLCAAKLKNRWGFIDALGQEVLPFVFEAVQEVGFFQGRAAINKAGTWVFINRSGEVEFPLDHGFQSLGNLSEGLAAICKLVDAGGVRYGYVDPDGRLKIALRYDRAEAFKRGFAIVGQRVAKEQSMVKEMRYGIIDRNGRQVIPVVLHSQTQARLKRDSLAFLGFTTLAERGRTCKIDARGHRFACVGNAIDAIQKAWMSTRCENSHLVAVARDGLWGFCDGRGKLVIPCRYAAVQCFESGLARVWPADGKGDLSYYIDESGRPYYIVS